MQRSLIFLFVWATLTMCAMNAAAGQVRCRTDWPNYALRYDGPYIQQPVFGEDQFESIRKNSTYFKFYRNEDCGTRLVEKYEQGALVWTDSYESIATRANIRAHRTFPDGRKEKLFFDESGRLINGQRGP